MGTGAAGGEAITGLLYAGNTEWDPDAPSASASPRWGWDPPPIAFAPATFIYRIHPVAQPNGGGYWTCFFDAQDSGHLVFDFANWNYWGCHPYPNPPEHGTPQWEISAFNGGDFLGAAVVFDQDYICVARMSASYLATFAYDWVSYAANNANGRIIQQGADEGDAPNRVLCWGDAPWRIGGEVFSGIMRGFQFYSSHLSNADVASELADPGSVASPWYLNLNPTPTDISDKSGNGNHPSWFGADRPTLWTPP